VLTISGRIDRAVHTDSVMAFFGSMKAAHRSSSCDCGFEEECEGSTS